MFYYVKTNVGTGTITITNEIEIEDKIEDQLRRVCEDVGETLVKVYGTLPYPSGRQINDSGGWPSFCWTPMNCLGYSCCPSRVRACTE